MVDTSITDNIYIYPTDTVWGIGGSIRSLKALNFVRKIKNRPDKPLSILFSDFDALTSSIRLPTQLPFAWIKKLYQLEVTILFNTTLIQNSKILPEIFMNGPLIGVRYLPYEWPATITNKSGGAITTTSLNFPQEPAIVDQASAKIFYLNLIKKYTQHTIEFISPQFNGMSQIESSIISFSDDFQKILFHRRGRHVSSINKLFRCLKS